MGSKFLEQVDEFKKELTQNVGIKPYGRDSFLGIHKRQIIYFIRHVK